MTAHVRSGTNTVRFIQLADLSEYVYVLHALPSAMPEQLESTKHNDITQIPEKTAGNQKSLRWQSYLATSRRGVNSKSEPGIHSDTFNIGASVTVS